MVFSDRWLDWLWTINGYWYWFLAYPIKTIYNFIYIWFPLLFWWEFWGFQFQNIAEGHNFRECWSTDHMYNSEVEFYFSICFQIVLAVITLLYHNGWVQISCKVLNYGLQMQKLSLHYAHRQHQIHCSTKHSI